MSISLEKERIQFLRSEIRKHDELYEQNKPIISDGEYDALYFELVDLEKKHPDCFDLTSPTQRIYTKMVDGLEKVRHTAFMGSQEKIKSWDGVIQFLSRFVGAVIAQHKLDGLTIVLTYKDGLLQLAVTRGDGEVGQNVIHTVRTIRNLPSIIPFKNRLVVRMEAIIPYAEFERINVDGEYSNPRNLVSGTIAQHNAEIAAERNIKGIVFDIIEAEGITFTTLSEQLQFLREQGFETVESRTFEQTEAGKKELQDFIHHVEKEARNELPYMIDGLIIKFDDLQSQTELGNTSKHPKWSIAYKFASLEATTILEGVEHSVGRTGQITPVGLLKTVDIGVNVSRASLANYGDIKARDIRIGDTVVVIRSNDVIPKITSAIKAVRTGAEQEIEAPTTCPSCGAETVFDGANLFCKGENCEPQMQGKIEHFASRKALNINTLGESTVALFFEKGFVRHFLDLFKLQEKKDEICALDGFGIKSFDKLQKELERIKTEPLHKVLIALSVKHLGESKSKDLSKIYPDIDAILEAAEHPDDFKTKLLSIPDFGQAIVESIVNFFTDPKSREMLNELKTLGFTMKSELYKATSVLTENLPLSGQTVVITGTLDTMGRDEATEKLEALGAKVSGSVSKKTSFVVVGREAGSKETKARELGVKIVGEQELLQLLGL